MKKEVFMNKISNKLLVFPIILMSFLFLTHLSVETVYASPSDEEPVYTSTPEEETVYRSTADERFAMRFIAFSKQAHETTADTALNLMAVALIVGLVTCFALWVTDSSPKTPPNKTIHRSIHENQQATKQNHEQALPSADSEMDTEKDKDKDKK